MRLNNWSIAASYDTARIFAGLGFGSSTASRSIISRPRRTGLCSGSMQSAFMSMARSIAMARQTVHRAKSEAGYAPAPPFQDSMPAPLMPA